MELITIFIIATVAVATGATTFFITKGAYNDEHEKIKAHIKNQLIIREEQDRSHEFSQTLFLILLAIVTSVIVVYISLKCIIQAVLNKSQRQNQQQRQEAIQNDAFEA